MSLTWRRGPVNLPPRTLGPGAAAPHAKERDWAAARAIAKAVTWRLLAAVDTFVWSYLVAGQPWAGGQIASLETVTKIALFYAHERAWRVVRWMPSARLRSLMKAVTWRFIGSADTFILSPAEAGRRVGAAHRARAC